MTPPESGKRWWIIRWIQGGHHGLAAGLKWQQGPTCGHQGAINKVSSGYFTHRLFSYIACSRATVDYSNTEVGLTIPNGTHLTIPVAAQRSDEGEEMGSEYFFADRQAGQIMYSDPNPCDQLKEFPN